MIVCSPKPATTSLVVSCCPRPSCSPAQDQKTPPSLGARQRCPAVVARGAFGSEAAEETMIRSQNGEWPQRGHFAWVARGAFGSEAAEETMIRSLNGESPQR